ncbi:putative vacuolar protein sorting protein [Myriangium duriaei CBS 260.36]|uniref:Vacuolar protein-sorting-associated protein 36 n=1 Tax=Myriangium duriaei CBS 260.36 TaxID=1168546 RepID=A0A9P4J281_9PEZI|nr:putative vacuolar protein sorting protein [Myriangium duriaei CBS 260.36]
MTLRQLDLTTALRPSLLPEEVLLFVQDSVGLYRDNAKIEGHQNGHAYLTSHRICYVDNDEPRQRSVAIDLKAVDYPDYYAGFFKSSPKITLYPKANRPRQLVIRPSAQPYNSTAFASASSSPTWSSFTSTSPSPAPPPPPRDTNATWICPICSFSNPVPSNFDPATANANTPLPPCLACGIKPPLVHLTKATIAAMSNRPASAPLGNRSMPTRPVDTIDSSHQKPSSAYTECPRCTFRNHPSIPNCEICGASLSTLRNPQLISVTQPSRTESPAPTVPAASAAPDPSQDIIKLSFRDGGSQTFLDRLKDALIQRKWLLQSAPPIPRPDRSSPDILTPQPQPRRNIGIAALERRDHDLRKTNELVIGSAFADLEALMTSAKEVIAMAERFSTSSSSAGSESTSLLSAMGLTTTRDMLSATQSKTYITQLSRDLAEYLTDDAHGVLRKEGGVMTLVDLWAVFNRRRNGIELVSPRDFHAAVRLWDDLKLPLRLREFRSGVTVVQGRERTDDKTSAVIVGWMRGLRGVQEEEGWDVARFGRGVTALDAVGKFGWSLGVAVEELQMAEERGVLVRDQDASGISWWENAFGEVEVEGGKEGMRAGEAEQGLLGETRGTMVKSVV